MTNGQTREVSSGASLSGMIPLGTSTGCQWDPRVKEDDTDINWPRHARPLVVCTGIAFYQGLCRRGAAWGTGLVSGRTGITCNTGRGGRGSLALIPDSGHRPIIPLRHTEPWKRGLGGQAVGRVGGRQCPSHSSLKPILFTAISIPSVWYTGPQ